MPSESTTGRRALPIVPEVRQRPTLEQLTVWAKQVQNFLMHLTDDWSGVPGGFKGTTPNPTGPVGDPGTEDAGWQAVDSITPQGIVTTKGDVLGYSSVPARVPVGTNDQVLTADSVAALGVSYKDVSTLFTSDGLLLSFLMLGSEDDTDYPIYAPDGTLDVPAYSFGSAQSAGLYQDPSGPNTTVKGKDGSGTDSVGQRASLRSGRSTGNAAGGAASIQVTMPGSASGSGLNSYQNAFLVAGADGAITSGGLDVFGSPGTSTYGGVDRAAGVTDGGGGATVIAGGSSTGTGGEGPVRIALTPPAASTGSTQNSFRDTEIWDVGGLSEARGVNVELVTDNSGKMARQSFAELLTLSTSGTTTDTTANLLPAGAIILAVTTLVTTTISGGGVTVFSVGDPTTAARFSASAGGLTAGSTRVGLQHQQGSVATDAAGPVQTAAAKVRITTDATPTAGVVRIQVWALVFTAPAT